MHSCCVVCLTAHQRLPSFEQRSKKRKQDETVRGLYYVVQNLTQGMSTSAESLDLPCDIVNVKLIDKYGAHVGEESTFHLVVCLLIKLIYGIVVRDEIQQMATPYFAFFFCLFFFPGEEKEPT